MNVANLLTLLRIFCVPVFGVLWVRGDLRLALYLFVAAALTDVLDGMLARLLRQTSRLGALLDPLADKLMVLVSYAVATYVGAVPPWIAGVVIGRDVLIAGGFAVVSWHVRRAGGQPRQWPPSRLGKYATFFSLLTIAVVIVDGGARLAGLRAYVESLLVVTSVLAMVTAVQYVLAGVAALARPALAPKESR
jgi:cardiolipin synthase